MKHKNETPDVSHINNPDVTYEHNDVSVSAIMKFVIGLLLFAAIIHVVVLWMFNMFEQRESRAEKEARPAIVRSAEERLPPEPRLQLAPGHETHPLDDMDNYRDAQKRLLEGYGWINKESGTVRIPVEQAMHIIAERGLKPGQRAQDDEPPPAYDGVIPSQSSAGQQSERKLP
jgi:hypothetical protein